MMPVTEMAQIESTTISNRVRRRMWGFDLHSWEQIMLWSLGCAAIAALAVTVSTTAAVFLQKEESAASKHELELYKADAGKKISSAEADIAKANEEISKAHEAQLALEQLKTPDHSRTYSFQHLLKSYRNLSVRSLMPL
jgi:hypothetical protein